MLPFILAAVGGYLVYDSVKDKEKYAKGGKVKKLYAVLRSPMGEIIADTIVDSEDKAEAQKKFRDMGINVVGSISFTNNPPHYYANGGTTVVEEFGANFRNQYEDWEMVVISKGLEKDGGQYLKGRYLVSAKNIEEAKKIATELWEKEMGNSDFHIVKVMSDSLYRLKYMDVYADGGMMADGGMISLSKYYQTLPSKQDLVGLRVYDENNDEFVYKRCRRWHFCW